MTIKKIVITGGPCGGKSTALNKIREEFMSLAYTVLMIPETATELINGGIAPWTTPTNAFYQECQMQLQMKKEEVFEKAAASMNAEKVLIVCDRGMLDNKAYMTGDEFSRVCEKLGKTEVELRDNYDAVFHLVTAADGALHAYTTANNTARTENPAQAIETDRKTVSAWTGHPHLRVIDNSTDFDNKIKRLVKEIASFLGEPQPYEIERKFLIEYPDTAFLESLAECRKINIIQTYLNCDDESEIRVRQRGENGSFVFFKTEKRRIDDTKRIEIEEKITEKEYLALLMDADTSRHQIRKDRYCLSSDKFYYEIDVYPFWKDKAICEIELSDENTEIVFPEFIRVIKEVTHDETYKNAALSKR